MYIHIYYMNLVFVNPPNTKFKENKFYIQKEETTMKRHITQILHEWPYIYEKLMSNQRNTT